MEIYDKAEQNDNKPILDEDIIVDKLKISLSATNQARINNENDIIYDLFNKQNLESMIHISCGTLSETQKILFNLTETIENFKYFGCDLNKNLIEMCMARFKHVSHKWKFENLNFIQQSLPDNYDLILSRMALMYLSADKIFDTLNVIANTKQAKYFLTSIYNVNYNRNLDNGKFRRVNLLIHPFNLTKYVDIFQVNKNKMFILYDIPNYLSKIDFESIKNKL